MSQRQHKRRLVGAGLAATLAFTGLSVGVGPVFADSTAYAATGEGRLKGKFVVDHHNETRLGIMADAGDSSGSLVARVGSYSSARDAAGIYTFPKPGTTDVIRNEAGLCAVSGTPMKLATCNGSPDQLWNLTTAGILTSREGRGVQGYGFPGTDHSVMYAASNAPVPISQLDLRDMTLEHPGFTALVESTDLPSRSAVLKGSANPGASVVINSTHEVRADSQGNWSFKVTGLKLGANQVFVEHYEGGTLTDSATVEVSLRAAEITASIDFAGDVFQSATVSGTAHPGATVEIWRAGTKVTTTTAHAVTGRFSTALRAPGAGGTQVYTVSQVVGGETAPGAIEVLGEYGSAVSIDTPADGQVHPGGPVTFQGRGVPGGSIQLQEKGKPGSVGSATVLSNGMWTIQVANVVKHNVSYVAEQTGRGANVTTATVELNPGITDEVLDVLTPAEGAELPEGTVTFTGKANPGATVELLSSHTGGVLGSTTARADGTWTATTNRALTAGQYVVTVKNGGLQVLRAFTVKAPVVLPLTVTAPAQNATLNAGKVTFTGTATPHIRVELRSNVTSSLLGVATADANGNWSADITKNLGPDFYSIRVVAGTQNVDRQFTVQEKQTQGFLNVSSPAQNAVVNPGIVTFTGSANAGAAIELRSNVTGALLGSATANANGDWTADIDRALGTSRYIIVVTNGTIRVERSFEVGEQPLQRPLSVSSPAQNATLTSGTVTFTGAAADNARVELRSNVTGSLLGVGTADASGNWSATITRTLAPDFYSVQVVSDGQRVDRQFTVKEKPAEGHLDVHTPAQNGVVSPGPVTFTGTATPGAKVELRSNVTGILLGEGLANASGNWSATTFQQLGVAHYVILVKSGGLQIDRAFQVL